MSETVPESFKKVFAGLPYTDEQIARIWRERPASVTAENFDPELGRLAAEDSEVQAVATLDLLLHPNGKTTEEA